MKKYNSRYRIESARLKNWDYGDAALYFVTICTQNRVHYFGEIKNGEMQLYELGKIVTSEWIKTFEIRQDMNLSMGDFVVMPNHFHAIIGIGENAYNTRYDRDAMHYGGAMKYRDAMHGVSTFGPQSKNMASIIRGFKSSVTVYARKNGIDFGWQSGYYDHIIRNNESFQKISNYIINNPVNWQEDKFFKTT
ncbi:MAG: transposase [Flavobacteriaceae bacterium]